MQQEHDEFGYSIEPTVHEVLERDEDSEAYGEEFRASMAVVAAHAMKVALDGADVSINAVEPEAPAVAPPSSHDQLTIKDLMEIYGCGYSKAQKIMAKLPNKFKVGREVRVLRKDLEAYIKRNGRISLDWPSKGSR